MRHYNEQKRPKMLNKKKSVKILIFSLLVIILFLFFYTKVPNSVSENKNQIKDQSSPFPTSLPASHSKVSTSTSLIKNLRPFLKFCPELSQGIGDEDEIMESNNFALNLHFVKEQRTHRIRVFTEDATEGSFQKLVYFIEDEDGFPEIIPQENKIAINPTPQMIESLIKDSEIIFKSEDINIRLKSGKDIAATIENGRIKKLISGEIECP
jgi:hypothetical protein